jgi:hypothetical protein
MSDGRPRPYGRPMSTTHDVTTRQRGTAPPPDDTEARAPDRRPASRRGRAVALGVVVGCLAGASVAWAVSDGGGGPSATTPNGATPRPAVVMSADAAEHRAAERRDDCLTLGTADAVARCLDAPSNPVG